MFFARGQDLMTRRAVVGDHLAIGAGVVAIMAAEAAGRVVVPKIVRVRAPGYVHVGKYVAQVDIRHFLSRLLHLIAPRPFNFRIISLIKLGYFTGDVLPSYFASGVIHLEDFDRLFLDIGKSRADSTG